MLIENIFCVDLVDIFIQKCMSLTLQLTIIYVISIALTEVHAYNFIFRASPAALCCVLE